MPAGQELIKIGSLGISHFAFEDGVSGYAFSCNITPTVLHILISFLWWRLGWEGKGITTTT